MISGLSTAEVERLRLQYGANNFKAEHKRNHGIIALLARFKNPLIIILLAAATLSLFFGDKASFFIIVSIVGLSVTLDFTNSYRSEKAAEKLKSKVRVIVRVIREGTEHEVSVEQLVPGDIVLLKAGSLVPADGEIVDSHDLYCNESSLTGESFPQAKLPKAEVYMGSGVASGSGIMRVKTIGSGTKFAGVVANLQSKHTQTEFEKEIKIFSLLIIRITFVLVILIFSANALLKHNILESLLFSLALAVGLTPELLPLIITLNLTKGSLSMAKNGVIVKQLSAVQNFGSMDILCTDKTGTLTEDKIVLVKYVDGLGKTSDEVLQFGYLVSAFSTSFSNPLDTAVKNASGVSKHGYEKIDEIPFDFERRREAVIVHHSGRNKRTLIVKGSPEEVIDISSSFSAKTSKHLALKTYEQLSQDGFRVLAVAAKHIKPEKRYEPSDENKLKFYGFLAFLDPAKQSASEALALMSKLGIAIKIITGDNILVSEKVAKDIGISTGGSINGDDLGKLDDKSLALAVEKNTIFARVNPEQKMSIIESLRHNGHVVGYMGDGINDAPSLQTADVSISVNNAVDVAKEAADFIMLDKNLHELAQGVIEGRKTFANTMKYLRMSLSSNFGNMISMAAASLFLPFLPMLATQILLNNLLYDSSQFALPLDNVDDDELFKPGTMSLANLKSFMWSYGILSSVFDILTFGVLLWMFHADEAIFQAGWFLESIFTQILVIYIIRSRFGLSKHSRPSLALIISTSTALTIALLIVLLPIRQIFHFGYLGAAQILMLGAIVSLYLFAAEEMKNWFYKR